MNEMISYPPASSPLPMTNDYPAALALRQLSALVDDLPKYLLAPEVSALLHFIPDLCRKMLFTTLWNTGARISEALALTRGYFLLRQQYPFRSAGHAQAARGEGRAPRRTPGSQRCASPAGVAV